MATPKQERLQPEADIEFNSECGLLLSSANDFVASHGGMDAARGLLGSERGYDPGVWSQICELGWLGVALPEASGGSELDAVGLVTLVESMGRGLLASPFLATTLASQLLLSAGSDAQRATWLAKLASGEAMGSVALLDADGSWDLTRPQATATPDGDGYLLDGVKVQVLDAGSADLLLVSAELGAASGPGSAGTGLFLVESAQLPAGAIAPHTLIDGTRRAHTLILAGTRVPASALLSGADASNSLARIDRLGALLIAAEMAGGTHGVLELTLEYLRTRTQFGKLIGGYQALKHPMVELVGALERSRSLVYAAATSYARDPDSPATQTAVRMAKAHCGETFTEATDRSVQFHGAIGFTYECHAQLFFRRAQWAEYAYGDARHHRQRLQGLLLDT